jgi:hypothetical protein
LCRAVLPGHRVEAETYARAEQAFGHKWLVDMVLLIGLYLTTCSLINARHAPPTPRPATPPGDQRYRPGHTSTAPSNGSAGLMGGVAVRGWDSAKSGGRSRPTAKIRLRSP